MPLIITSKLPPPQDWKEFESLTRDVLSEKWNSPDLEMNGRQGQNQAGVDLFGENHKGKFVGVQCKNTDNLNFQTVLDEARKAESFRPAINVFYIATTGKRDSMLQETVRMENESRKALGKFKIRLMFWDDFQSELANNMKLFNKYYSQFVTQFSEQPKVGGNRLVSALDLGFYGLNVRSIMGVSFGALACTEKDIREFYAMLEFIEEALTVFADSKQLLKRIKALRNFKEEIDAIVNGSVRKWKRANELAEAFENSMHGLTRWLSSIEVKSFKLGAQIGSWDYYDLYHDESYSEAKLKRLSAKILEVLEAAKLPDEIEEYISDYLDPRSEMGKASNAPMRTYNWLRNYFLTI